MIDLDHFKELNDTLGHYAGDQLLSRSARACRASCATRAVARLGGDEFGLILRDDVGGRRGRPSASTRALARPFELDELTVSVQASIGIAVFPKDAQTTDGLLRRADIAMYQAKDERSRYSFYAPAADHGSRERLGLVADLKRAIEQGGLDRPLPAADRPAHQHRQRRGGAGALAAPRARAARRRHASSPIAEQTGVMRELTASVLEQALAQQRAWLDEGRELNLAVNVSATNLLDTAFLADLQQRARALAHAPRDAASRDHRDAS